MSPHPTCSQANAMAVMLSATSCRPGLSNVCTVTSVVVCLLFRDLLALADHSLSIIKCSRLHGLMAYTAAEKICHRAGTLCLRSGGLEALRGAWPRTCLSVPGSGWVNQLSRRHRRTAALMRPGESPLTEKQHHEVAPIQAKPKRMWNDDRPVAQSATPRLGVTTGHPSSTCSILWRRSCRSGSLRNSKFSEAWIAAVLKGLEAECPWRM